MGAITRARGCLPAYYSPAMEAARPVGGGGGRPGTVSRPVNTRRAGRVPRDRACAARGAVLDLDDGCLPRARADPLFDGSAAVDLATWFSTENPDRVPGTVGAENATLVSGDDLGPRARHRGRRVDRGPADLGPWASQRRHGDSRAVEEALVLVAHRDNADVASMSATTPPRQLHAIELPGFAPQESAPTALAERTLVIVSTDAGAYGGAGARRFARTSPYAESAIAAVVLDGFDRLGEPRIAIMNRAVSPARAHSYAPRQPVSRSRRGGGGAVLGAHAARRPRDSVRGRGAGTAARRRALSRDDRRDRPRAPTTPPGRRRPSAGWAERPRRSSAR